MRSSSGITSPSMKMAFEFTALRPILSIGVMAILSRSTSV